MKKILPFFGIIILLGVVIVVSLNQLTENSGAKPQANRKQGIQPSTDTSFSTGLPIPSITPNEIAGIQTLGEVSPPQEDLLTEENETEPASTQIAQSNNILVHSPLPEDYIEPSVIPDIPAGAIPNQTILHFSEGTSPSQIQEYLAKVDGTVIQEFAIGNQTIVVLNIADTVPLPSADFVTFEKNYYVTALTDPISNDLHAPEQWALPVIHAADGWAALPEAAQVIVGLVDSGICSTHPELQGRFVNGKNFVEEGQFPEDDSGHACASAGIISATTNNDIGIAGAAPNSVIMPLRVLKNGTGTYTDVAEAIVYATDQGVHIINLSLGGNNPSPILHQAIQYAHQKGVLIIAAAGNTGQQEVLFPAAYDEVVAVASIDPDMQISNFSSYGVEIDIKAPGRNILTTSLNGDFIYVSGTSFAAAYTTAVAALEIGLGRTLTLGDIASVGGNHEISTVPTPTPIPSPPPVQPDVVSAVADGGQVRVIITLREPVSALTNESIYLQAVEDSQVDVLESLSATPFELTQQYTYIPAITGIITEAELAILQNHPLVLSVKIDEPIYAHLEESREVLRVDEASQYYQEHVGAGPLTGEGVTVAVMDSGIDSSHVDLNDDLVAQYCALNRGMANTPDSGLCYPDNTSNSTQAKDQSGHGTLVSGIITKPQVGMAPDAGIVAVQVLDALGSGYVSDWLAGLEWIIQNQEKYNIRVLNMSLGTAQRYTSTCDAQYPEVANAVNQLIQKNVVIFASSGNEGDKEAITAPACLSQVIAVGATYDVNMAQPMPENGTYRDRLRNRRWADCRDNTQDVNSVACFTNSNTLVDIVAPGATILSSQMTGGQVLGVGTSMASPMAAGAAALLLQANPDLTPSQIKAILKNSGRSATDSKNGLAFPLIDVREAIAQALDTTFACQSGDVECETLVTFYNTANGADWANSDGWLQLDHPICTWNGITCQNGHVVSLRLPANGLSGFITPQIQNLRFLQDFDVSGNSISGTIPPEIAGLTNLRTLNLSANQFSGSIPPEITALNQLSRLRLDNNLLSGDIPDTFTNLSQLTALDLGYNALLTPSNTALRNFLAQKNRGWERTQTIPPANVRAVIENGRIRVSWTPIPYTQDAGYYVIGYGLSPDGPFLKLHTTTSKSDESYYIDNPRPGQTTFIYIKTYTAAHGIQKNALTSIASQTVSVELASYCDTYNDQAGRNDCKALEQIYYETNGIRWTNASNWLKPNTSFCNWFGIICDVNGTHVVALDLSNNNLEGRLPLNLDLLASLESLRLGNNKLTGPIPSAIGRLNKLRVLQLNDNNFNHQIPTLVALTKLEQLWLQNNKLNGAFPQSLTTLSRLKELRVENNLLSGSLPANFNTMLALEVLSLAQNGFIGNLPTGYPTQLQELNLSQNLLNGSIPSTLGSAVNLEVLDLSQNRLTGSIPPTLGDASKLHILNLARNEITGAIPAELGNLTSLTDLNLSGNKLTGNIPASLGQLLNLTMLNLSSNALGGAVPNELAQLNVEQLQADFGYNMLTASFAEISTFLLRVDPDWEMTQTVAPINVQAVPVSPTSITILWTPIHYTEHDGYYEILCSDVEPVKTQTKADGKYTISGLKVNQRYTCAVRTYTASHDLQQNNLTSGISAETATNTNNVSVNPGPREILVQDDTFVSATAPNSDKSNDWGLMIGGYNDYWGGYLDQSRTLLHFGVVTLPDDAVVTSAVLRVYHYGTTGTFGVAQLVDAKQITSSWTPSSVIWNSQPFYGTDYGDGRFNYFNSNGGFQVVEFPLSTSVIELLKAPNNYGIALLHQNERPYTGVVICSENPRSDNNFCLGNAPRLIINYRLNLQPTLVSNPIPSDGAVDVDPNVTLQWTGSTDPNNDIVKYNIYLGTDRNNLASIVQGHPSTFFEPSGLLFNTTYYWRVDSTDPYNGVTTGTVWQFTTRQAVDCDEVTGISKSECHALVTLHEELEGENWKYDTNWRSSTTPCGAGENMGWYGVECDKNGSVTSLYLRDNNLKGELPAAIKDLPYLRYLDLSGNEIDGNLPPELGHLANLKRLKLYDNQLTGTIPVEVSTMSNLEILDLHDNQLTGAIPPELDKLGKLEELRLQSNRLEGSLPATLGNLIHLKQLNLANNQFSGDIPASFVNLVNINPGNLMVDYNRFTASDDGVRDFLDQKNVGWASTQTVAPAEVQIELATADTITLSWQPIAYQNHTGHYEVFYSTTAGGSYQPGCRTTSKTENSCEIDRLTPGQTYYIKIRSYTATHDDQHNALYSDYTEEYIANTSPSICVDAQGVSKAECQALEMIYLHTDGENWTNRQGWLNNDVCQWHGVECDNNKVVELNLAQNNLRGELPASIPSLINLRELDLSRNHLTGQILPAGWSSLVNLQTLNLAGNLFVGQATSTLPQLTSLTYLNIDYNGLIAKDVEVREFLNNMSPDWAITQTVAPTQVTVGNPSSTSAVISWTPIAYTSDPGGYIVQYGTDLTDEIRDGCTTSDKIATQCTVTGLAPGRTYSFTVVAFTDAHAEQPNKLISEKSESERGTTLPTNNTIENATRIEHVPFEDIKEISQEELENDLIPSCRKVTDEQGYYYAFGGGYYYAFGGGYYYAFGGGYYYAFGGGYYYAFGSGSVNLEVNTKESTLDTVMAIWVQNSDGQWVELGCSDDIDENNLTSRLSVPAPGEDQTYIIVVGTNNRIETMSALANEPAQSQSQFLYFRADIVTSLTCDDTKEIPAEECWALESLYASTNGEGWQDKGGWMINPSACQWFGVSCSGGHVIGLQLPGNRLNGSIPPEIGLLKNLQELDLSDNSIIGPIPSELGSMPYLQFLHLSNNQLSDAIPPELGNLENLRWLDLSNNRLTGNIPVTFGNLTSLGDLYLQNNVLSGEFPATLASLPGLRGLDIRYNMLQSSNPVTTTFLDDRQSGWAETQTVAPQNVVAVAFSNTAFQLTWTPILYTADGGHYEILYATSPDGPYQVYAVTTDKTVSTYMVDNLQKDKTYYLAVRTYTPAHGEQQNDLLSPISSPVVIFTNIGVPVECDGMAFDAPPIYGTGRSDEIFGTDGNDLIFGKSGDDYLYGAGGNDCLVGGSGSDELFDGAGDDVLIGNRGADVLRASFGNDVVIGGSGSDALWGGPGNDVLKAGIGDDSAFGGAGDDHLYGDSGHDAPLVGNGGNDILYGGSGHDELYGDTIGKRRYAERDTVPGINDGSPGNDQLYGENGHDLLYGGGLDDRLDGGLGHDQLYGEPGDDLLTGGPNSDFMHGGPNFDEVTDYEFQTDSRCREVEAGCETNTLKTLILTPICQGKWSVFNPNTRSISYTWSVDGSPETGSGRVSAQATNFFFTDTSAVLVRLRVNGVEQGFQVAATNQCQRASLDSTILQFIQAEDASIIQDGEWIEVESSLAENGSYLQSTDSDDYLVFSFDGTELHIVFVYISNATIVVEVDGTAHEVSISGAAPIFSRASISLSLVDGEHTVEVYSEDGFIGIDYFGVDPGF